MTGEIQIRVRYAEVDRMGLLHHSNYLVYFEQGRVELLRQAGFTYKDMEDQGYLMVLTGVQLRFRRPAYFDDLLTLKTTVTRATSVKIVYKQELFRDGGLVAEGEVTLGCVDRQGQIQLLPEFLQGKRGE